MYAWILKYYYREQQDQEQPKLYTKVEVGYHTWNQARKELQVEYERLLKFAMNRGHSFTTVVSSIFKEVTE